MRTYFVMVVFFFSFLAANAQEKDRFKFAQTYFGIGGNILADTRGLHSLNTSQRISFGGLHFWGKADFYVSFAFANQNFGSGYNISEGVMTGGRWIPFVKPYGNSDIAKLENSSFSMAKRLAFWPSKFCFTKAFGLL